MSVSRLPNDERTAKRVSDALGVATELRAMKNYAGHRLSPWLGHLMVSRQETARPLLTAGEVMQLPPADELVFVSGTPPIRARKARYFEDRRLTDRVRSPPGGGATGVRTPTQGEGDDWMALPIPASVPQEDRSQRADDDGANGGIRREPTLPEHEAIVSEASESAPTVAVFDDRSNEANSRSAAIRHRLRSVARQAAMDPDDGMAL